MVFGFLYLDADLVIYDVCEENINGLPAFVASLSADPRVRFSGPRPEMAASQLVAHLRTARQAAGHPAQVSVIWTSEV